MEPSMMPLLNVKNVPTPAPVAEGTPARTVKLYEIPGTLLVEWNSEVNAIVDTWSSYFITAAKFREAVMGAGLSYARSYRCRAWVMDASGVKAGAYPQEVQDLIAKEVFKAFAVVGIKYFLTIKSPSVVANMAINRANVNLAPVGIKLVDVPTLAAAIEWLRANQ
jgi:hypothetical protein